MISGSTISTLHSGVGFETAVTMNALLLAIQLVAMFTSVEGHGRLTDPPSRVTMGRYFEGYAYDTTDNGYNCGGVKTAKGEDKPNCNVCGGVGANPPNEPPNGKFANDFIVRTYTQGQIIEVKSELTANHKGEMEYRICENNEKQAKVDYDCLNKNLLVGEDGVTTAFKITTTTFNIDVMHRVKLPPNLTCTRCVFQWRYRAGNSWNAGCTGCGKQETFQACADIEIKGNGNTNVAEVKPDVPDKTPEVDISVPVGNKSCNCTEAISPAMCHSISTGRRWSNRH